MKFTLNISRLVQFIIPTTKHHMSTDSKPSSGTQGLAHPDPLPPSQLAPSQPDSLASPAFVLPGTPRVVPLQKVSTSSADSGASCESGGSGESSEPLVADNSYLNPGAVRDSEHCGQEPTQRRWGGKTYGRPMIIICVMAILVVLLLLAAIAFALSIIANLAVQRASVSYLPWFHFNLA